MSELKHIGTATSGRYPKGSGDKYHRNPDFLTQVHDLKKKGLSELDVAIGMGMKVSDLRNRISIERAAKRAADQAMAQRLYDKGMSKVAIGERMGLNESSVRALLNPTLKDRANITKATAEVLKENVAKKKYIDIGLGTEVHMAVSRTKLNTAVAMLEDEGYKVYYVKVPQLMGSGGKNTSLKVLTAPGVEYPEVFKAARAGNIRLVNDYSEDGGRTYIPPMPVQSISRKRIFVRDGDNGGKDKDGVIELRRGVEDLSLGNAKYAQVRIAVDGTHYMKGMAIYSDHIPDGYDIVYNSNKKPGDPKTFKKMEVDKATGEIDKDNPFGSSVRQKHYIGADGKDHISALNIVGSTPGAGEEGAWGEWSRNISSQVLSKQTPALAKKQLGIAYDMKKEEYDEIMSLTNPAVKKRLLETFGDEADSAAVHLKAAALPRQSSHVLLPITSMKENEVYAPHYENGEPVVLIRHPHGGRFEIPELIVNNKNPEALSIMKDAKDAVGINPKVAQRLSGADFDGDTVLVIPNKNGNIKTSSAIKSLLTFDPKAAYPKYDGMKVMSDDTKQHKMGEISNLITDMTIKGANEDEIARAVRHSMVVIDAVKHELNYVQSYKDENIAQLKQLYQGKANGGASTIISKAKSEKHIPQRKEGVLIPNGVDPRTGEPKYKRVYIDPATGKRLYTETGASEQYRDVVDPVTGKKTRKYGEGPIHYITQKSTKMAEETDARKLSSGTNMENIYADYANSLKALANKARKASIEIEDTPYSPSAREAYAPEVASLKSKLSDAFKNKPLERQAQLLANNIVTAKRKNNPQFDEDDIKRLKRQTLEDMRARTGAQKSLVDITDREWEAIQAGAVSNNALTQILLNTDIDKLKQRAMPHTSIALSPARINRARMMRANGETAAAIAQALGVSVDVIEKAFE